MSTNLGTVSGINGRAVHVTRYFAGEKHGTGVQLTLDDDGSFIRLDQKGVGELMQLLASAIPNANASAAPWVHVTRNQLVEWASMLAGSNPRTVLSAIDEVIDEINEVIEETP